jgi:hypothetical protein
MNYFDAPTRKVRAIFSGIHIAQWGPWQLFWLALVIRLAVIVIFHYYNVRTSEDHFGFGYEMGRIARALATGHGYADPFHGHTGPTAWIAPVFPLILSGIFKIFGVYSKLSALAILSFDSLISALIVPLVWETGERCFGLKVARWSAWIWALYPASMQFAVKWIWEMTLTAFLFQLAVVIALRMGRIGNGENGPTWKRWLSFGLVWGLIALTNPSPLLFLPVCGIWVLARGGRAWTRQLPKAVCAGLLFFAMIAPWVIRNERTFHASIPFRSNFGAELYMGNGPGANGFLMEYDHPNMSIVQYKLYAKMGEVSYTSWRGKLARQTISADLPRFAKLCLIRAYFFWFGVPNPSGHLGNDFGRALNYGFTSVAALLGLALALRRRLPAARLFAAAFVLLPMVYYIVTAHARFRHPLEPLMTVLGVFLFQQAKRQWGFSYFRFTLPRGWRISSWARGKQRASALEGRIERSRHGLLNPMTVQGFHTAPPGRESFGRTLPQGFTLGYFRLFPPGRTALDASLFPHLELLH